MVEVQGAMYTYGEATIEVAAPPIESEEPLMAENVKN